MKEQERCLANIAELCCQFFEISSNNYYEVKAIMSVSVVAIQPSND